MTAIKARIQVAEDHSISGAAPDVVPAGEHEVVIIFNEPGSPPKFFHSSELPLHDLPWDGSISLHREDMYGDDGR